MTQTSVLDTAGFVNHTRRPVLARSDWRDGVLLTRNVNGVARDLRAFTLTWRPANAYQRRSLRQHFADNAFAVFDLNLSSGSVARVTYGSAPVVRATSATAVEMSVELIEVQAES